MTEDEAKTKWCPFARVEGPYAYGNPAINRNIDNGNPAKNSKCIGSACMAWRGDWFYEVVPTNSEGVADKRPFKVRGAEIDAYRSAHWIITDLGPSGFCGLAGAPQ
jgi:hypothetical protein